MESKIALVLLYSLILTVVNLTQVYAATDIELEELERQIEELEIEQKKQTEAEVKAEAKRKAKEESEKKREAEEKRLAELERQRMEEETKKRAEEEKKAIYESTITKARQAIKEYDKQLAISKFNEILALYPKDKTAVDGIKEAEKLMEKGCYDVIGTWTYKKSLMDLEELFRGDGTQRFKRNDKTWDGTWECLDAEKRIFITRDNYHTDGKYTIKGHELCDVNICYKRGK